MVHTFWTTNDYITTWNQFDKVVRSEGCKLLKRLDEFPNSTLVTGCQRSGTTTLARTITQSDGMVNYWFGPDDELDGALILSGYVDHEPLGRYCFQTTYINECYHEYYDHPNGHKIVWVLRNPFSVVYSMLFNWYDYGLNGLFGACGVPRLTGTDAWLYRLLGVQGVNRLRRACWAYNGKTSQLFDLQQHLAQDALMVVEYDDLVTRKEVVLPAIYDFINLKYQYKYADKIHAKSLSKADRLDRREAATIRSLCQPVYDKAKSLITNI